MQKIELLLNKIEQENFQNDVDWLTGTQSWQDLKKEILLLLQQHDVSGRSEQLPPADYVPKDDYDKAIQEIGRLQVELRDAVDAIDDLSRGSDF